MSLVAFKHPLALTVFAFILVNCLTLATDRFAIPAKVWNENIPVRTTSEVLSDLLARSVIVAVFFAFFFAISWRPVYAFAATFSTFTIFSLVSRAKFEFIREPLIFSDIALVLLVFRHKEMFYATWLNVVFWVFAFGYVFGVSTLFMVFEPSVLPLQERPLLICLMVALAAAPWLLLFQRNVRETFAGISARLVAHDNIKILTIRLGTLPAVVYPFLTWTAKRSAPVPREVTKVQPSADDMAETRQAQGTGSPLLIVWQSESFMDMRRFGVSSLSLANLDRLRTRAAEWGRLSSIFEGGYTLRTEFSVITGLRPEELGPDAAYPYLRAATYSSFAWPNRLRARGWSTRFVHPYDRRFFSRDRALPLLGFEAMTMIDAFDHDSAGAGRYVSDLSLSKRVLEFCRDGNAGSGQLVFCASMENHGPWGADRVPGLTDPLAIYLDILQRSDAALGFLADELDKLERPIWLIFYGDHAPILKSFADPFSDPRTDYMIVPLGQAKHWEPEGPRISEKGPWDLIADTVARFGVEGLDAVEAATPARSRKT